MGHWEKCSNKAIIKPDSEEGANWGMVLRRVYVPLAASCMDVLSLLICTSLIDN